MFTVHVDRRIFFNKMILKAIDMRLFKGMQVGRRTIQINHLQFGNETLVFSEVNYQYL